MRNNIYDASGHLFIDSRKGLHLSYNSLNLLSEVKKGNKVKARYRYLSDGTKLRVRDGSGANGYDYLSSLIYRKSSAGEALEGAE